MFKSVTWLQELIQRIVEAEARLTQQCFDRGEDEASQICLELTRGEVSATDSDSVTAE